MMGRPNKAKEFETNGYEQGGFPNYLKEHVPRWDDVPRIEREFMIQHTRRMADRLFKASGHQDQLIRGAKRMDDLELAKVVYGANFVLVSHDKNRLFDYGNEWARALWRFGDYFIGTPSEETTPPEFRRAREKLITGVDYKVLNNAVRHCPVSGTKFEIPSVTIWSMEPVAEGDSGLAAKYGNWRYLT